MSFGIECLPFCERIAYVNPPEQKILQLKLMNPLTKSPIRFFDMSQLDEALAWTRQDS